uniref:PHM7_ext domain-containing protein n=1 Tax=Brugia timori TaxID=42155 RepID=A0A0R3R931_9BILA
LSLRQSSDGVISSYRKHSARQDIFLVQAKKSSEEVAAVITKKETTVVQHKTEIRMQVSYGEDDPFA